MGNFKRDNKSGDGRNFNRGSFDRRGSDRPMHKTTCSKCGNECEVPFKPSGDKPVYCNTCFDKNRGSDSRRFDRRNSGKSNFSDRRMYNVVCDKCGANCKVPFQPRGGKPVYCSQCFEGKNDRGGRNTEQYKEQFEVLNTKLDKILKMLTPVVSTKVVPEEKMVKEIEDPKPKKQTDNVEKKKKAAKKTISIKKK